MAVASPTADEEVKITHRKIYFHLSPRSEIDLKHITKDQWALARLPSIKDPRQYGYYKADCTKRSKLLQEQTIHSPVRFSVEENLKSLLYKAQSIPSVHSIKFKARFGSIYFNLQHRCKKTQTIRDFNREKRRQEFLFGIPFDVQHFILSDYLDSNIESHEVNYNVKFIQCDEKGQLVTAASSCITEQADGTFKHTRTSTTEHRGKKAGFKEETKLDIVRPGRCVDIRIVSHLKKPSCTPDSPVYVIAAGIARSTVKIPEDDQHSEHDVSMQLVGENYYITFVRKKITKKYRWKDTTNPSWRVKEREAYNCVNINEEDCKSRKLNGQLCYGTVQFNADQVRKEISFNGTTHSIKPSTDPEVHISTPDHILSDYDNFVGASFQIAEVLDQ